MNAKNAICHETIMFFLYLFSEVIFNNLYVKYAVRVVQIRVIIESINGKIELVSNQISDDLKVPGIFIESPSINVIISITILQITQAIRLQSELISISGKEIFWGQNDIVY